jgi:predicted RNA-binding Zn-ribbon protein involved in translation (DUF1610 family)
VGFFKRLFGGTRAPATRPSAARTSAPNMTSTVKCPKCGHNFGTRAELKQKLATRMGGGAFGQAMFGNQNSTNVVPTRCPSCSAEIMLSI